MKVTLNGNPKTLKELEDPEILVSGFGVLLASQVKARPKKMIEKLNDYERLGNWSTLAKECETVAIWAKAAEAVESLMASPQYKRKVTLAKKDNG